MSQGCDQINDYSDLIYIINVCPSEFERQISYTSGSVKKMIEKNQILAFVDNRFLTPAQYKITEKDNLNKGSVNSRPLYFNHDIRRNNQYN